MANAHGGHSKKKGPLSAYALFGSMFAIGFAVPALVYAAPKTFAELVDVIISIINPLVGLLVSLAVLFFSYNIIRYITNAGGEGRAKYRENLTWSVIALFVLVSVWGLARIISNTFLNSASSQQQQTQTPEEFTRQVI